MKYQEVVTRLFSEHQKPFYLFDLDAFRSNLEVFSGAFVGRYEPFRLAYSYKSNYTPAVCRIAHAAGALAEVVSEFEYDLALRNQVAAEEIIVNGPVHRKSFLARVLSDGAQLNVDGFEMLDRVLEICAETPGEQFLIGLRFGFPLPDERNSRFGFGSGDHEIELVHEKLRRTGNVRVNALHCHFSTGRRSEHSFYSRAAGLSGLLLEAFNGEPVEQLNVGGGFFGAMPESLAQQFGVTIPTFADYAEAVVKGVTETLPNGNRPTLVAEPGSGVVADIGCFACPVVDIKESGGRLLALVDGSIYNIKPTLNPKNLPFSIVRMGIGEPKEGVFDFVGYTCMETDYLCANAAASLAVGDLVVFGNVGGYTTVLKPPFIRPQEAVYGIQDGGVKLLKREESTADVMGTYS